MNKSTSVRQILAALGDALEAQDTNAFLNDPMSFVSKIPKRSLSGEHILGGKVLEFASSGITDKASKEQLVITNGGVTVTRVNGTLNIEDELKSPLITAGKVVVDVLEVKELKADIKFEKNEPIKFTGDDLYGQGLLWVGNGHTKQFVYSSGPDKFFSSENIDLDRDKYLSINNIKVLDEKELGPTVTKSNLREVGRLKGLIVDGSMSINSYLYFNATADRLGLGTEEPNAAFSVVEDNVEMLIGTKDSTRGMIGTFASHSLDIVTDNISRLNVSSGGNILLGNTKTPPVQVSVHGKLAIRVNTPDPEVDLHVSGAIKYNGRLQKYDKSFPTAGSYNPGDIVWNIEPRLGSYAGWICVHAGDPGVWEPFGKIGNQ